MNRIFKRYSILLTFLLFLIIWVVYQNGQTYHYPDKNELTQKINYLSRIIKSPLDDISDIITLKSKNPEWMLFSLSFSTFALTNISMLDSTFKPQAIEIIDSSIQKALTETIYSRYSDYDPFFPEIDSSGSILYFGHLNMMLGCYRLLTDNPKYNELNDKLTDCIYKQYLLSKFYNIESYPGRIWIPDNAAGIASLKLHSMNTGSMYAHLCPEWIEYVRTHYTDKETGLLFSTIDFQTGKPLEEPRGSMIGWTIFFMYRFDKEYARNLYENYKDKFSTNLSVIRLYSERYKSWTTNLGDIDSGPILLGYGIPASGFAFGNAVAFNDWKDAERLHRLVALGNKHNSKNNEITYKPRFENLNFSPLAESLGLYFETMTEWRKQ